MITMMEEIMTAKPYISQRDWLPKIILENNKLSVLGCWFICNSDGTARSTKKRTTDEVQTKKMPFSVESSTIVS